MKERVHQVLEVAARGDRLSRAFDVFIVTLIALNVVAMILESVRSFYDLAPWFFRWFEIVSIAVFSLEYVLRVWSCTASETYRAPLSGRLRFMRTPLALVDLLAVLPFYLPFVGVDLRSFRAIRLFRVFRIAKLSRYSQAIRLTGRVLLSRSAELVTTVFVLLLLLVFASTLMYFAERDAQSDAFSSIPAAMWWAIATLSTVGYGDVYPVTTAGRLLASVIAVLGIGMFALPTGILGAAFVEEIRPKKRTPLQCPGCGAELDHNAN